MTNWIEKFFGDYAEAFRSNSKTCILQKLTVPLVFLTPNGPFALNDSDGLSANLETLIGRYQKIGVADFNYAISKAERIGSGIHMVDVEWRFLDADGELIYACNTSYLLAGETSADARVMAVIAHNENEEYQKALSRKHFIEKTNKR
jgi:hypothetical protein